MLDTKTIDGIYIYTGYTDLRKSINGLSLIVGSTYGTTDLSNKLFIFCGKRKDTLKIIQFDGDGVWLYIKKLNNSKFKWNKTSDLVVIDKRQLDWLLSGLSYIQPSAHIQKEPKIYY